MSPTASSHPARSGGASVAHAAKPTKHAIAEAFSELFSQLKLTHQELSESLGVSTKTIQKWENDADSGSRFHLSHLSKLIELVDSKIADTSGNTNPKHLTNARRKFLDELNKFFGGGTHGLMYTWLIEAGEPAYKKALDMTLQDILTSRGKERLYGFKEMAGMAQALFQIPAITKPENFWRHPRIEQCKRAIAEDDALRGRPAPLTYFHMAIECLGDKVESGGCAMLILGHSVPVAERHNLTHFRYAEPEAVREILSDEKFIALAKGVAGLSLAEWSASYTKQKPWIHAQLGAIARSRQINNTSLAECLDGIAPERSGQDVNRVTSYLKGQLACSNLPFAVLAYLIAETPQEAKSLIATARKEMRADLYRQGALKRNLEPYVERLLWGLSLEEVDHINPKDLASLENRGIGPLKNKLDESIAAITRTGEKRLLQPLQRWNASNNYDSVSSFYLTAANLHGADNLVDRIHAAKPSVFNFRRQADVPTLYKLKGHAAALGINVSDRLQLDWQERYARKLCTWNYSDLARAVFTLVARTAEEPIGLFKDRKSDIKQMQACFTKISRTGHLNKNELTELLTKLGYPENSLTAQFIQAVNQTGNIGQAIQLCIAGEKGDLATQAARTVTKFLELHDTARQDPATVIAEKFRGKPAVRDNERAFIDLQSQMPGATFNEFRMALSGKFDATLGLPRILQQLHTKARSLKISDALIAHCAEASRFGVSEMPFATYRHLLRLGQTAEFFPPALVLHTASTTAEEIKSGREAIYAAIENRYEVIGITPTISQLEMAFYGVSVDELTSGRFYANVHAIADPNQKDNSENKILKEIREIGSKRLEKALARFSAILNPARIGDLIPVYAVNHRGQQEKINTSVGINNRLEANYQEGSKVPTLPRLRRMMATMGTPLRPAWTVTWSFDYAKFCHDRGFHPLARMYSTGLASGAFPASKKPGARFLAKSPPRVLYTPNPEQRVAIDLGVEKGRTTRGMGTIANAFLYEGTEDPARFKELLDLLEYNADSRAELLQSIFDNRSRPLVHAVVDFFNREENRSFRDEASFNFLAQSAFAARPQLAEKYLYETRDPALTEVLSQDKFPKALQLANLLAGLTREEFLAVYLRLFTVDMFTGTTDQRAKLFYGKALNENGQWPEDQDFYEAFSEHRASLMAISIRDAGHWRSTFLAMRHFSDPFGATNKLVELLRNNRTLRKDVANLDVHLSNLRKKKGAPLDFEAALPSLYT
jgi:transcriptional regulator with XRE-family HTH domain